MLCSTFYTNSMIKQQSVHADLKKGKEVMHVISFSTLTLGRLFLIISIYSLASNKTKTLHLQVFQLRIQALNGRMR